MSDGLVIFHLVMAVLYCFLMGKWLRWNKQQALLAFFFYWVGAILAFWVL